MTRAMGKGPHAIVMDACRWIARDRGRWDDLASLCLTWHELHPGRRLRRGDLYSRAEDFGMEVSLAKRFRFDNNLWSVLSRFLVMRYPRLTRAIHHRWSEVDEVDLRAAWRLFVDMDDSCFVCDSWRQARAMRDLGDAMGGAA